MMIARINYMGIFMLVFLFGATQALCNEHKGHHHKAFHGGCLNVINQCELAHIEVKVTGDTMTCWFIGGGQDTDKAVRIPDLKIVFVVKSVNQEDRQLILKPKPIELAEEKPGDASRFEGRADWLKGLLQFEAHGQAMVKGRARDIYIHFPGGYTQGHEHKHVHSETDHHE